ncbi:kinase-like protein [Teratosphaeria destructans]|uniref:Kinase-like protein n=1 Tax=Teratosphaeria destructans TaxID=418781 RepID=A0A9W7SKC8_9PEZI|nr:kinase-like protein [Teratosphaeria destructans]
MMIRAPTERIEAPHLGTRWVFRSEESKRKVLQQLKTMVEGLRSLEAPQGIGAANIDSGPIFALVDDQDLTTIQDESCSDLQELAKFYQQPWHDPVFTHGDLSSTNILCE